LPDCVSAVGARRLVHIFRTVARVLLLPPLFFLTPFAARAQGPAPHSSGPIPAPRVALPDYGKIVQEGIWAGAVQFLEHFWWLIALAVIVTIVRARIDAANETRGRKPGSTRQERRTAAAVQAVVLGTAGWLLLSGWSLVLVGALVATLLGAAVCATLILRHYQGKALAEAGIDQIDHMDGLGFEQYLEVLYKRLGYRVQRTPYAGDWGADLVLERDGVRTVVQAKRWNRRVGVEAVQQVVAAKAKYGCTKASVVTNSHYTQQAQDLARANGVLLWDRSELVTAALAAQARASKDQSPEPPQPMDASAFAPPDQKLGQKRQGNVTVPAAPTMACLSPEDTAATEPLATAPVPVCLVCSMPVSERVRHYCEMNRARFGGQIYCYEHQKTVCPAAEKASYPRANAAAPDTTNLSEGSPRRYPT